MRWFAIRQQITLLLKTNSRPVILRKKHYESNKNDDPDNGKRSQSKECEHNGGLGKGGFATPDKRRHIVRIKMSIVRTTEGKSTTMIDMFLNNSEDKRINGMVGKDFIQKDGMTTTVSYSLLSTRKKAEPRYVEDADLGDKAHWAVIKIMIRRLCESSMI